MEKGTVPFLKRIERLRWDFDVIVVGAGPGGSTAARFCARYGLKTLLIEKERFPRYKPCGGCLSLKTVHLLDFNLTPVIENTIVGAKFSYCLKEPFFIEFKKPIAFLVMRDRFDQFLLEKALEEGVEILEGEKVVNVQEKGKGIEVELASGEKFHSHYLIGADGAESIVARSISLSPHGNDGNGIAIQSEIPFDSSIPFPEKELHFIHLDFGGIPNGYSWVFPKKDWLSIGIGRMFRETKKMNPRQYLNNFFKGLTYVPEGKTEIMRGHLLPSFYDEKQKVSQGEILLVGDAGHLMDPLQGEGIYYAIRSGMLAADAIIESVKRGIPSSHLYQEAVEVHISENLKWALSFSRFIFRFTKLAYQTLRHYPELSGLYLQVLEGRETYQGFVSGVKGRIRAFMKGRLSEKIRRAMAKA
ncbi:MAG: NAD(P)/FAD-dependent oxidoreductase [Deltaproteobacteria bacterium]|nr:NAD(P)/FAD-dependent oxidoreductase [Deltaproteobacteria bacterium]